MQLARKVSAADGTLSLEGVAPSTLYLSDRPERVVGHTTAVQFVEHWTKGPDSFAEDPPNAVLPFPNTLRQLEDAVVMLINPELDGDRLRCDITVLEGAVPAVAGSSTLFIDLLGPPLSPVAVAGMDQRNRRRGL